MAIAATDIKMWLTGVEVVDDPQPDPNASLGGNRSLTEWVNATKNGLFDAITAAEGLNGENEYRSIIIQNKHATLTLMNARVWIELQPDGGRATEESIQIATEAVVTNAIQTIINENTAPTAVSFSAPTDYATGLDLGDIVPDGEIGLWFKRVVPADVEAILNAGFGIRIQGKTLPS